MMTFNEAINILESGDEEKAFEMALKDEGISKDITKEEWLKFAYAVIACRENEINQQNARYYE